MKQLEVLLKLDAGKKFDTPKKLNRSTDPINPTFIDQVEAGEMTTELIDSLAGYLPIFRYRTCLTIHGDWPAITRTSIGSYKNLHQNQNGSMEVYYSAIDTKKIEAIREALRGTDTPFRFQQSSTSRGFYLAKGITKETKEQVRAELQPLAEELSKLNIYGSVQIYLSMDLMGRYYLVLSLDVQAIPEVEVQPVIATLSRLTPEEYAAKREAYKIQVAAEEAKREEDKKTYEAERLLKAEAMKKKYEEVIKPLLDNLTECRDLSKGILVAGSISRIMQTVNLVFYRLDGRGSFGRIKYSVAYGESLDTTSLEWKERKQAPLNEILNPKTKYYLAQPFQTESKPTLEKKTVDKRTVENKTNPEPKPAQDPGQVQEATHEKKVLLTINL